MSATPSDRTAEIARLLEFFDNLASRGKKHNLSDDSPHDPRHAQDLNGGPLDADSESDPTTSGSETAAERDVKKNRLLEYATNLKLTAGSNAKRPRRNTVSVGITSPSSSSLLDSISISDMSDDEISLAKFPLSNRRPFTFRLMLHKLYEREDWIKKVRESLEQSKKEYKPLAEYLEDVRRCKTKNTVDAKEATGTRTETAPGRVHFAAGHGLGHPGGSTRNSAVGRPRSVSIASPSVTTNKALDNGFGRVANRPVKKRCIGRRKSLSELNRAGNTWVYDALVSQLESDHSQAKQRSYRLQNDVDQQDKKTRRRISLGAGEGRGGGAAIRKRAQTTVSSSVLIRDIGNCAGLKRRLAS